MSKLKVTLSLYLSLFYVISWSQFPIEWDAGVFGTSYEELYGLAELPNGDLILGGSTYSNQGGDVAVAPPGGGDFFLVRTDAVGQVQWSEVYGGSGLDRMTSLALTPQNDIVYIGHSNSPNDGDKSAASFGSNDYWVIKTDDKGNLLWESSFGGSEDDFALSVAVAPSGNIFVLGYSNSPPSGNKSATHFGSNDYWLIKLSPDGQKIWDKSYGGSGDERLYYGSLTITQDGQLLIAGSSDSPVHAMKSTPNYGSMDYWLIKIDVDGQILWEATYGAGDEEQAQDVYPTKDGGYLIAGSTRSGPGGIKSSAFYGLIDYWLIKINASGQLEWEQSFGGSGLEVAVSVVENDAGRIMIGGLSDSPVEGNKTAANLGDYDYWILFLEQDGTINWQQTYGWDGSDAMTCMMRLSNGGYLVGGNSYSDIGGEKTTGQFGFNDWWFFELGCDWFYESDYKFFGCVDEPIEMNLAQQDCDGCRFIWPDGTESATYAFSSSETTIENWDVVVLNSNGCPLDKQVSVHVEERPIFSLGEDTVVYNQTSVVLRPAPGYLAGDFLWSTGDTSIALVVSESGTYGLWITNEACSSYEEIDVELAGHRSVFIPTIFTPNGDGYNDLFQILGDEAISSVKRFEIASRWGDRVFMASDFVPGLDSPGWDGLLHGRPAALGVYVYVLEVEYTDGTIDYLAGDVLLVR